MRDENHARGSVRRLLPRAAGTRVDAGVRDSGAGTAAAWGGDRESDTHTGGAGRG